MDTYFRNPLCVFSNFQFPQNLDELKSLAILLRKYQEQKPLYVFVLFCSAYLYKQTFAIPGSVFMVSMCRGYILYTAVRRYEIYLRVVKTNILRTSEASECSVYYIVVNNLRPKSVILIFDQ